MDCAVWIISKIGWHCSFYFLKFSKSKVVQRIWNLTSGMKLIFQKVRLMVCGHFKDACSLASSQIKKWRTSSLEPINETELSGMMESAGMVFVQSCRELGSNRKAALFDELKVLFGSVEAIPIQVVLTGACMQISEGITSNLTIILEEFLNKWKYVDNNHYAINTDDQNQNNCICPWQSALDLEKYLQVAEVFTMVLLGRVLCQPELAISWIEKSDLPEVKRQDMLKRLHSLQSIANSISSISSVTVQTVESVGETPSGAEVLGAFSNSSKYMNGGRSKLDASKIMNPSIKYLTHRNSPFWWFSNVHLKLGGVHLVLRHGRIFLIGLVMAFAFYFLKKKASELKKQFRSFAWRQALFIQRVLIDAWQLAFSVQVNPLASVQPISASPRSNR